MQRDAQLLDFYQRELSYLRLSGKHYAQQYPKIARRLDLNGSESTDPHTERLIESFAFLTARLQREIEDRFPKISSALLENLYPHLITPFPSSTIAKFCVDPAKGKFTSAYVIARDTKLFSDSEQGVTCRFKTAYETELWPIEIANVDIISSTTYDLPAGNYSPKLLRLRIKTLDKPLSTYPIKKLRFYINAELTLARLIYEMIFSQENVQAFQVKPCENIEKSTVRLLSQHSVMPVGFAEEHALVPYRSSAHPAYRLLQEYVCFPQKYLFFDVLNLDTSDFDDEMELIFTISSFDVAQKKINFSPDMFQLGCTPAVNLFEKISEPLRLDQRHYEYRLVADMRREKSTEIHSILEVNTISDGDAEPILQAPYFSFQHDWKKMDQKSFWYAKRQATFRQDLPGTDIFLSFINFNFDPFVPKQEVAYAKLLCTNRDAAEQIPPKGLMQVEDAAPVSMIYTLMRPTSQYYGPEKGFTQWQLVSHLSLNHTSLIDPEHGIENLKEMLHLYTNFKQPSSLLEVDAMHKLNVKNVVRRLRREAWRGFAQGVGIELTFNESVRDGSVFLFATVLNHFLNMYVSINSFVEFSIRSNQRDGVWKRWPIQMGEQFLL